MGLHGPDELHPRMLRRRIDHEQVLSYQELFANLEPGELLGPAPSVY